MKRQRTVQRGSTGAVGAREKTVTVRVKQNGKPARTVTIRGASTSRTVKKAESLMDVLRRLLKGKR